MPAPLIFRLLPAFRDLLIIKDMKKVVGKMQSVAFSNIV
jgi:hypothetical protein